MNGTPITPSLDFRNVSIFETPTSRTIECTTAVYAFGQKVLETAELKAAIRQDGRFFYEFDMVGAFFGEWLKGLSRMDSREQEVAAEGLLVVQVRCHRSGCLSQ